MKRVPILETVSFIVGFTLLAFELGAARLLAPAIGSSTYVWTSVIGTIIAALALGYWVGGIVADRRHSRSDPALLLLAVAFSIAVTHVIEPTVLTYISALPIDTRLQGVIIALILFAPTSYLLGMIGPYLAKLNVTSLEVSGRRIASIDAFNSLGGIVGTFLTGFILFNIVGVRELLSVLVVIVMITSWLIMPRNRWKLRLGFSVICIAVAWLPQSQAASTDLTINTPSAHYQIVDFSTDNRSARGLLTGVNGIQSASYTDGSDDLVFWYTKTMSDLAVSRQPQSILLLGGGTFSIPGYLQTTLPETNIDVIEVDPELLSIANKYFYYSPGHNTQHIFDDARHFVNQSNKKYDVIMVDVYGDGSIPFSLATDEYGTRIEKLLNPNGVVIANIIGGLKGGPCQTVFQSVDSAYRTHLPYGYYSYDTNKNPERTNIITVYAREPLSLATFTPLLKPPVLPFSDNFSPIERPYFNCASHL